MKSPISSLPVAPPSFALALGIGFAACTAQAAPYACDLTNNAGIVSFRLNENADNVKVLSAGGTVVKDLGAGTKGLTVTNLGIAAGPISVVVTRSATPGYTQISADGFQDGGVYVNKFEQPRGVVVNKNPASPSFGRIFVNNSRVGTTAGTYVRINAEGIYMLNSDNTIALDTGVTPRKAGILFDTGTDDAVSPMRLTIGKDDNLLYMSDLSDPFGGIWVSDLDVTTGTNVLDVIGDPSSSGAVTHGSTYAMVVEGSLANGNLKMFTMDEDLIPIRSCWRYDIGSGPLPFTGTATGLGQEMINSTIDLVRGGSANYLYASQNRSAGTDAPSIFVFAEDGTVITNSLQATRDFLGNPSAADLFRNTVAMDLSPDGATLALLRGVSFGRVWLVPLKDGVFDFAGTNSFSYGSSASDSTRDLCYDAAGNLYVISSASEWLRIFSRGGYTIATTGSDGTFTLQVPTPVSVTVDNNLISETSPKTAVVTFTRPTDATATALTITFTLGGTAARGTDFVVQTNSVTFTNSTLTIPAGQTAASMALVAQDDTVAELAETVVVGLVSSPTYSEGIPGSQTVAILDNESPAADLEVVSGTVYERLANDYARLRVVRRGDTNAPSFTVNLAYSGTATPDVDYGTVPNVTIDPGVVRQNFDLPPIDDNLLEGDETITCSVISGSGYTVGTTSPSVNATILDDELPAETVLWSEDFNNPDNAANWKVLFGSGNGIDDYRYYFGYDYAAGSWIPSIPPAPHSTNDTLGLYLAVNKDEASALGAAGINVYPIGKTFRGNYAVRFDMYLMVGGASTTEHALFGINHSGTKTNWFRSGGVPAGWTFDGLFYGVEADAAAYGDYVIYSGPTTAGNNPTALTPGRNASTLTGVFKSPPFTYAGAPANGDGSATPNWVDVEISHVNGVVTLTMNRTVIMSYTNTTGFTSGNVMLGHCDSFDSIGSINSGVVYDNLRVIQLAVTPTSRPNITQIKLVGGNVEIYFTGESSDAASGFGLQEAATVNGTYSDVTATFTGTAGSFKAVRAIGGSQQYYRVKRNN